MTEKGRVILTVSSLAIIVVLSLLVAWVTFGLLQSSAQADVRGYKLSGAIAAFAFTAGLLISSFFNVYRLLTADQLKEYAKRIEELQAKLIRGAPCPPGYAIDLDEKHKLVFARPGSWQPQEGILYQYVEQAKPNDPIKANFNVVYRDVTVELGDKFDPAQAFDVDELYESALDTVAAKIPGAMTKEYITVDGFKSVKYINTYPLPQDKSVNLRQSGVMTFIPRMKALYVFTCTDDEKDYLASSAVFNTVIASIRFL